MKLQIKKIIGKLFGVKTTVDSSDLKGYVNYDYGFTLKFLPKCGSTSVLRMLYELENGVPFDREFDGRIHRWAKTKKLAPMSNVKRRIIIIRDPVKRFLSAYSNRVIDKKQLSKMYVEEKAPLVFPEIRHFNPTITQFIDEFEVYNKVSIIRHHTAPICDFIKPWSLDYFTDVIPMERISMIEDVMSDIFNCKAVLGRAHVSEKKIRLSDLSEQCLNKILDFYSEDYECLADYYTKDALIHEWKAGNKQREI
ncbi:MAG: hypothetical protein ACI9N9_001368 [Enterobacterales bacterium]|jgi:hypothetical protein